MSLEEETAKKVIRQVEFYFSDSNLPKDSFLKKTISESDDGMISLALICSFSRMRGHLGLGDVKPEDVSEDIVKAVAETLRTSTFLKISVDGRKIGRVTELAKPYEVIKQLDDRTVAASPLEYDAKLEDVESFFTQYAKVNSVRLPQHVADNRLFCGTALIEFSCEEDAASVLKQNLSYSGVELELKPKKEFDAHRAKQEEELKKDRPQRSSNRRDKVNTEPEYPKGLIVAFKLKRITVEDSGKHNDNHELASYNAVSSEEDGKQDMGKGNSEEAKEEAPENAGECEEMEAEDAEESPDIPDGNEDGESVEEKRITAGFERNKDVVMREDLKRVFQKFGTVKFIDFTMGSESGYARFEDEAAATKARAAAVLAEEGGLCVKNFIATLDPVTGEAEKEYWSLLRNNQEKRRDNFKGNRGRGGKHNKGGRQFSGKKHSCPRGNDSPNRPNKARKVEAA